MISFRNLTDKPVLRESRQAARIIYHALDKRRDTLLYAGLIGLLVGDAYTNKKIDPFFLSKELAVACARESLRVTYWLPPSKKIAGYFTEANTRQMKNSALTVACFAGAAFLSCVATPDITAQIRTAAAIVAAFGCANAPGGIKGVFQCYRDVLFDHPRKGSNSGTSHHDNDGGAPQSLLEKLLQPALVPLKIKTKQRPNRHRNCAPTGLTQPAGF